MEIQNHEDEDVHENLLMTKKTIVDGSTGVNKLKGITECLCLMTDAEKH